MSLCKVCPICKKVATGPDEVELMFGYRTMRGIKQPQARCKPCRSGTMGRKPKPLGAQPKAKAPKAQAADKKNDELYTTKCDDCGDVVPTAQVLAVGTNLYCNNCALDPANREQRPAVAEQKAPSGEQFDAIGEQLPVVCEQDQVLEVTERWTQCNWCQRMYTRDPKAAGWVHDYGDEWTCRRCDREDSQEVHHKLGVDKLILCIGAAYDKSNPYKREMSKTKIESRVKALEKIKMRSEEETLELALFKDVLKRIELKKKQQYPSSYPGDVDLKKHDVIIRILLKWEPPAPIPETVKI